MTCSKSMSEGVPSIKILIDDFVIPYALFKISSETTILAIGSAIVKLNVHMSIEAIIAPTDPNKSLVRV